MKSWIRFILAIIVIVSVSCSGRKAYTTNGKGGYGPDAAYYYHHHHPAYHPDRIERGTYARNKIYFSPGNHNDNY